MSDRGPISPCTSVCQLDPATGWCRGCWRTIEEIASWPRLSAAEKGRVLDLLAERRALPHAGHEARSLPKG